MSSSILTVATGSNAEQGSSIKMTSGCTAIVRAMHKRCCWPPESAVPGDLQFVFDFIPQGRAAQALLDNLIERAFLDCARQPHAIGHVLINRFRERVWPLKHHADASAHRNRVDGQRRKFRRLVQLERTGYARGRHQIVHAVERAQQCAFAAPGRADDRGDAPVAHRHTDIANRAKSAVEDRNTASSAILVPPSLAPVRACPFA